MGNVSRRTLTLKVPLGFLLSVIVLLLVVVVLFGWVVQHRASGLTKAGPLGDIALAIAQSPKTALDVLRALRTKISGEPIALIVGYEATGDAKLEPVPGLDTYAMVGPRQRFTGERAKGWRVLVGLFNTRKGFQSGAIVLDTDMKVVHFWPLNEDGIDHPNKQEALFKFPHGFAVLPDGSVLTAFDNGVSLRRLGVCGEEIWSATGAYHHSITVDPAGKSLWTLRYNDDDASAYPTRNGFARLSVADGSVEQEITFDELIGANPGLDIFGLRGGSWLIDPFHENDVDPLPAALAPSYRPLFEEGDLAISLRHNNLVFVLDPDNKRIKWWRFGATRRQHDPDWNAHGTLTIFDNNNDRGNSRISEINPVTYETKILLDGSGYDFYTSGRGKHQILPDGSLLVVSSEQGRVFEVDQAGRIVFEFVNYRDDETTSAFILSEATWLPEDFFDFDEFPRCSGG